MTDDTNSELLNRLGGDVADQAEFEQVVMHHFGHGAHISDVEIAHGRQQGGSALSLIYTKGGALVGAKAGADLTDDDIKALRGKVDEQLLTPGPTKVRRKVLFTAVPTRGWFRYADTFQIFPLPDDAPRPPAMLGDHPSFLEFKYPSSPDFMISIMRQNRISRELELVCSSLLSWRVWSMGPEIPFHWTIDPLEPAPSQPQRSSCLHRLKNWSGVAMIVARLRK